MAAYGLGRDSTARLVAFARRSICPGLIRFAGPGGEKPAMYENLGVSPPFLTRGGFPGVVTAGPSPSPS